MALFGRQQQGPQFKNVWVRTIGLAEFSDDTPDGLTITSGVWYTWRYRVPAQQVIRLGSGAIMNGVEFQSLFSWMLLCDPAPFCPI